MNQRITKGVRALLKRWSSLTQEHQMLLVIAALALVTRLYKVVNKELWFDEVLDIIQAQKPVIQIFQDVKITPLHYLFVHFFSLFSSNIEWLRIPSIVFGVASVVLMYYTIKKIADKRVALFSAFMLAISPMHIEFSQQILHYSYFIFFTILTLYFFFDLVFEKQLRLQTILLFLAATACNVASHLSAVLVMQIQAVFLVTYYLFHPLQSKRKIGGFLRSPLNALIVLSIFVAMVFAAIRVNYLHVFTTYSKFNANAPITLGYSLTAQLKTGTITSFPASFYYAMFSWFGNGGGYQLVLFATLFVIGLLLLAKRRFWVSVFVSLWISGPFILLYISRLSHWFEEKYFIFIIPVYLFTISYGVMHLIDIIARGIGRSKQRTSLYIVATIVLTLLSVGPINVRTTYGYLVEGDQQFSWRKAIESIKKHMGHDDRIMAIDDKFLKAYMGRENRNKTWMSEEDLIHFTPKQYMDIVSAPYTYYYISIPDVADMRIGSAITSSSIGLAGGFNTYKINFQKTTPIDFNGSYIENFMKMSYLKDASDWSNVIMSYNADVNIKYPQTELDNLIYLVPKSKTNAYMTYKFTLKNPQNLYLRVNSFEEKNGELSISAASGNAPAVVLKPLTERSRQHYYDRVYDLSEFASSHDLVITYRFHYLPQTYTNKFEVGLKSFGLVTSTYNDPQLEKLPDGSYRYDANLEVGKDKKWWTETYRNFGWVQTRYGILYRLAGGDDDALVYRFSLPAGITSGTLMTKTFTKDNAINISVSNTDSDYQQIARHSNELKEIEHTYALAPNLINTPQYLYVRIQGDQQGQLAALRNLVLTLK